MRGLNLSRLARTSESSFFSKKQVAQASDLRSKLTAAELAKVNTHKSGKSPTVDVLPEIVAHAASMRIVQASAKQAPIVSGQVRPLMARLAQSVETGEVTIRKDPPILRALGPGRLAVYNEFSKHNQTQARPLPGGDRYADGAMVGMASFSIATGIVASIGFAGGLVLYFNPRVVNMFRERSVLFREWLDERIGKHIRASVHRRWEEGSLLSSSKRDGVEKIARSSIGLPTKNVNNDTAQDGKKEKSLERE